MALNVGIVGLPNVGKSTLFSALTAAPAECANYPFCTINPNVGIVNIPDKRLTRLADLIPPQRLIPATVEFVDIAGLVAGASQGEGLGNRFLAHIREVGVIAHVVRCFDDPDIIHVNHTVNPVSDIETIDTELALADLETVEKRMERCARLIKSAPKDRLPALKAESELLVRLREALGRSRAVRFLEYTEDEAAVLNELHLLTAKKQIYVCNVDESGLEADNEWVQAVKAHAAAEGGDSPAPVVVICGKLEAEIAQLDNEADRLAFLEAAHLPESGLNRLVQTAYELLGLRTFFTAGPDEDRAWTFAAGAKAPQAAGIIHSDFEKGFIKAEVYNCRDLFELGSEQKVKAAGKLRIEGKAYTVQDGDVLFFRFNP